jgi:uncharacterized protein YneF (UPF0154 family)
VTRPIDKSNIDSTELGTRVRGGDGFDSAVSLEPGKYQLDHNQLTDQYDYFKVSVPKDEILSITLQNPQYPIRYSSQKGFYEDLFTNNIWSSLYVHAPDRQQVFYLHPQGSWSLVQTYLRAYSNTSFVFGNDSQVVSSYPSASNGFQTKSVTSGTDYVYLKVGDKILPQHKDAVFTISSEPILSAPQAPAGGVASDDNQKIDSVADANQDSVNSLTDPKTESKPAGLQNNLLIVSLGIGLGVLIILLLGYYIARKLRKTSIQEPMTQNNIPSMNPNVSMPPSIPNKPNENVSPLAPPPPPQI